MTFQDFANELDTYQYSQDHFNLVKECAELVVLGTYLDAQKFIHENAEFVEGVNGASDRGSYFMEGEIWDSVKDAGKAFAAKAKKIGGDIVEKLKKLILRFTGFLKRVFSKNTADELEAIAEENKEAAESIDFDKAELTDEQKAEIKEELDQMLGDNSEAVVPDKDVNQVMSKYQCHVSIRNLFEKWLTKEYGSVYDKETIHLLGQKFVNGICGSSIIFNSQKNGKWLSLNSLKDVFQKMVVNNNGVFQPNALQALNYTGGGITITNMNEVQQIIEDLNKVAASMDKIKIPAGDSKKEDAMKMQEWEKIMQMISTEVSSAINYINISTSKSKNNKIKVSTILEKIQGFGKAQGWYVKGKERSNRLRNEITKEIQSKGYEAESVEEAEEFEDIYLFNAETDMA